MKIGSQRSYLLNLENVAMTDIVMNLFLFFFISFSLLYTFNAQRVQKIDVKLPQASSSAPIDDPNQLNILLTNEGVIYIDKDIVTLKEFKERLSARYNANRRLMVILRADRLVRFKDIVHVLDVLNELGVSNLNIATVRE